LQHDSQVLWKEVSFGVCKTGMRQRAWQQRRGKGSIETIADETAWEALSGVREAKGKSEHVRVKCPERACACLACLVTPTFPFSPPLQHLLSSSSLPIQRPILFYPPCLSLLPHIFIQRGLAASLPLPSFPNFQLSRSPCVVRLIKGLSLQVRAACSLHTHHAHLQNA
jgi:hypothetical protein